MPDVLMKISGRAITERYKDMGDGTHALVVYTEDDGSTGAGTAVSVADGSDVALGVTTATAAGADGTGNYSVIAALKRGLLNWASALTALTSGAWRVSGFAAIPSASFSRPADTTAYTAGDLVANSTTAGSVTPLSITAARVAAGSLLASRVRLRKSGTALTAATFRVYLFSAAPTVANGDNGALSIAGSADCVGWADVTMATRADGTTVNPFSDGAFGFGDLNALVALASGQTVWALIEARAAYTPASGETFVVVLEAAQN